jgi:tetratricopeptide (TPR) repeat protein
MGFVQRLGGGAGVEDSLQATYKMLLEQLDGEVQGYVRRQIYQHSEYDFPTSIVAKVTGEAARIEPADVEAVLGDFLAHQRRDAEAEARLTKALAARPNLPRAHAALGLMRWWQGKRAEALPHLEKAVAGGSTNETAYYAYGYALATDGARDDARMIEAATALERALVLRPGYPAAQELLGYVYLQRKEYAKARDLLAPVVKAAPSNHDAALLLAAGFLGLNDAGAARPLGPILATSTDDSAKRQARALLSQVAAIENGSQARAEAAAIGISLPSSVEPSAPQQPRESRPILSLRPLQAGEQRTAGTFEAIECGEKGVTIVLATTSGPMRASVAEFSAITFVTFRSETGGSISCGAKPNLPALLTWRSNGTAMVAVAVEVVPDGYAP